ncbi:IS21-like element helper ATPase IstB [Desulfosporosinus sp.]|uniref:IS21-like element helper ATPase IstB n=1 Tax=Desulfosporosinus sp. TaxID=157907 RepID=UPI00262D3E09|nr:IS21-like element helper ATPase IstB [Desulfosporosinus sp.]MCO5386083.1 IS21-like element helper ATPase IstB [Desulfosporosinus sp.]
MINQTIDKLNSMKLRAMEQEYRRQTELPASATLPFDDRLAMIVDSEWLAKANNRLQRFLREANLREPSANLENINYEPKRKLDKGVIVRLADCAWVKEGKNLIVTGATGTGKTYLVSAFGNNACRKSLKVRSYRVNRLLTDLAIGRGDGSYNRLLNDLKKPDLLILDDFGMTSLDPGACRDLLEVVDDRHGRKSIAISAQLPVAMWHSVFEDATIADAVLDRLVNSAHRIELRGPSLRPHNPQNEGDDSATE